MGNESPSASVGGGVLLFQPFPFDMLGGVDVVVENLWRGLERVDPGLATIGIQDWIDAGDRVDNEGRRFIHLNFPSLPPAENGAFLRYLITLACRIPRILWELRRKRIRLVNFHFPTLNVFPLAVARRVGLWRGRIVLSFHGSDALAIDPRSPAWRFIASQVDVVTACSADLARRVAALNLFRDAPRVIYNGIDIQRFLARVGDEDLPVPQPYILNVGTFVSHKGQDVLLEAFARIASSFPEMNLVCVGGTDNGLWLEHIKEVAERNGIRERVFFLENQSQKKIATLMQHAECLAHSSRREGLPIVLIEAGASGLAVVSTSVGGIPEIIESGEHGLLVNPEDPSALASAITSALNAPVEAKCRAGKLKLRINDSFSSESMTKGYLDAYLGV